MQRGPCHPALFVNKYIFYTLKIGHDTELKTLCSLLTATCISLHHIFYDFETILMGGISHKYSAKYLEFFYSHSAIPSFQKYLVLNAVVKPYHTSYFLAAFERGHIKGKSRKIQRKKIPYFYSYSTIVRFSFILFITQIMNYDCNLLL